MKADLDLKGAKGNNCLHHFAEAGDVSNVRYLIEEYHMDASKVNDNRETVLDLALPHVNVVRYLTNFYKSSALINLLLHKDRVGKNTIHKCCEAGYLESLIEILTSLLKATSSENMIREILNQTDDLEQTPLIIAASSGYYNIVSFLCECNEVDVDSQDCNGDTALHKAVANHNANIAKILIKLGKASVHIKNKQNLSFLKKVSLLGKEKALFQEILLSEGLLKQKKKKANMENDEENFSKRNSFKKRIKKQKQKFGNFLLFGIRTN
jgi:ankyrin repeat protein